MSLYSVVNGKTVKVNQDEKPETPEKEDKNETSFKETLKNGNE